MEEEDERKLKMVQEIRIRLIEQDLHLLLFLFKKNATLL